MIKRIIKIILVTLIFLVSIVTGTSVSNASNVTIDTSMSNETIGELLSGKYPGFEVTLEDHSVYDSVAQNGIYCIQHGQSLGEQSNVALKYTVVNKLYFNGGEIYDTANGQRSYSIRNAQFAYIINQDNGSGKQTGPVQFAIWEWLTEWKNHPVQGTDMTLAEYHGIDPDMIIYNRKPSDAAYLHLAEEMLEEATAYAEGIQAGVAEEDQVFVENAIKGDVNVNDTATGVEFKSFIFTTEHEIADIIITDKNGITYNKDQIAIQDWQGNNLAVSDINTGKGGTTPQSFNVIINDPDVEASHFETYKVDIILDVLIYTGNVYFLDDITGSGNYNYQNMIIVVPDQFIKQFTETFEFGQEEEKILRIVKIDSDTGETLKNAEFNIKLIQDEYGNEVNKYIYLDEYGNYYYYDSQNQAGDFKSNSSGEVILRNLPYGTYEIFETRAPSGYIRETASKELIYKADGQVETIVFENTEDEDEREPEDVVYDGDLEGMVWIDEPRGKDNTYNNIYDAGEQGVPGVLVRVYYKPTGKLVAETITDENGEYIISNLYEDEDGYVSDTWVKYEGDYLENPSNYNVVFEYDGYKYESVEPGVNLTNGSKAVESLSDRTSFNERFYNVYGSGNTTGYTTNSSGSRKETLEYRDNGFTSDFLSPSKNYYVVENHDLPDSSEGSPNRRLDDDRFKITHWGDAPVSDSRRWVEHKYQNSDDITVYWYSRGIYNRDTVEEYEINDSYYITASTDNVGVKLDPYSEIMIREKTEIDGYSVEVMTYEGRIDLGSIRGRQEFLNLSADRWDEFYVEYEGWYTKSEIIGRYFWRDIDITVEGTVYNLKDSDDRQWLYDNEWIDEDLYEYGIGWINEKYMQYDAPDLGLRLRIEPDIALTNDLHSVKTSINGQTQAYGYLQGYENADPFTVDLRQADFNGSYDRAIYESDVTEANNAILSADEQFKMSAIYQIEMKNQSTNVTMYVNEITDYFDAEYMYDGNADNISVGLSIDNETLEIKDLISKSVSGYSNEFNKLTINTSHIEILPGETVKLYIEFKIPTDYVAELLSTESATQNNIAEVTSYRTEYTRWDGEVIPYGMIDKDSNAGNTIPTDISTFEDDADPGKSIRIVQDALPRELYGTVFEDSTSKSHEQVYTGDIREGNGIYDSGETGIEGIEVTLRDTTNSKIVHTTTTDENGNYKFEGFIPGFYTIEFDWGDTGELPYDNYNINNYKATIYNNASRETTNNWHKNDDEDIRMSDALDNYDHRIDIDNNILDINVDTETTIEETAEQTIMKSTTPEMSINFEDAEHPTLQYVEHLGGIYLGEDYQINNVDFGIVERAKQDVLMEKRISSMTLTLATGQTLIDIDITYNIDGSIDDITGEKGPLKQVPVENSNNKYRYTIEVDDEIIQGAKMEITYSYVVTNMSEVDYTSKSYYQYGYEQANNINDLGNIVEFDIAKIVDYLDKDWAVDLEAQSDEWKLVEDISNDVKTYVVNSEEDAFGIENTIESKLLLTRMSNENRDGTIIPETSLVNQGLPNTISYDLTVSKVLTTTDDMVFENEVEITNIIKTGGSEIQTTLGNYIPGTDLFGSESEHNEQDNDKADEIIIMPPTGANLDYVLPIVIGILSIGVIAVGIIFIKKKVLNHAK